MTVIEESADQFWIAKIHPQLYRWILGGLAVIERDIDGVTQEGFVHRNSKPFHHKEMNLMNVEGMQFIGAVFDDPVLNLALLYDDVWNIRRRIERYGGLAVDGDVKRHGTIWVVRILKLFRKI